jgi:hypothetical protein
MINFSNPDSIAKLKRKLKTVSPDWGEVMITIRKMIDSVSLELLAVCILPLCLAIPALCTAASPANPAAPADNLLLPMISSTIDPPEIPFPKPPPASPANLAARADGLLLPMISSTIDPPEIPFPKPPPACQGTTTMERTA